MRKYLFLLPALLLPIGAGCVPYHSGARSVTVLAEAPPTPLEEAIPYQARHDMVWVAGYWYWSGARYAWIPGRWLMPPQTGMVWYVGGYTAYGHGYAWSPGYWGYIDHQPRAVYVHNRHHPRRYYRGHRRGYRRSQRAHSSAHSRGYSRGRSHKARPHRGGRSSTPRPAYSPPRRSGRTSAPPAASPGPRPMTRSRGDRRRGRGSAPAASPPSRRGRSSAPPARGGKAPSRRGRSRAPAAD